MCVPAARTEDIWAKLVLELKETENGWETEKYDFTLCSIEGVIPNKKIMKIYAGLPKN